MIDVQDKFGTNDKGLYALTFPSPWRAVSSRSITE